MSFDWGRFAEKMLTPRTAGSVVLGAALVIATIALGWSDALQVARAIVQSGASLGVLAPVLVLLLGAVFAVGFSAAFLLITGVVGFVRWSAELRTRGQARGKAIIEAERAELEAKSAMSTHLRHLPLDERQLLESFLERASQSPDGFAALSESHAQLSMSIAACIASRPARWK